LESIILFVLFGVASTVIQAVIKNSKQQQSTADTKTVKPNIQPTIKTIYKSNVTGKGEVMNRSKEPVQKPKMQELNISIKPEMHKEEKLAEVSEDIVFAEEIEEASNESKYILPEDISFDELQRSIIMAEVLGKPKALRKTIR
jgi:hypothetical protein